MKQPWHGIRSTRLKNVTPPQAGLGVAPPPVPPPLQIPVVPPLIWVPLGEPDLAKQDARPAPTPNIINDYWNNPLQMFFATVHLPTAIRVWSVMISFISFDKSICYLIMYMYKANAILATPIAGLDDTSIYNVYKSNFEELTRNGFKPKLNVMDNQATKHIKKILTKEECKLQLVEPHTHFVNAAKWAIQTFKDAFIAAFATTDCNFQLQLWDKLRPQVINTLNMMQALRINPTKSAYKRLYSPYHWNWNPLAPLGCKAVMHEDSNTRRLWALQGVNRWYLGPLMDHYWCDIYYIPETRVYCILGSTKLFPQHCQFPNMTPHQQFCALMDELTNDTEQASMTLKGCRILHLLQDCIMALLAPLPTAKEQRVSDKSLQKACKAEQRVIDNSPIITIPKITDALLIIKACNPTAKWKLKVTPRVHWQITWNNTPGNVTDPIAPAMYIPIPSRAWTQIVTQHAINLLMCTELDLCNHMFTPIALLLSAVEHDPMHFEHFACPTVHPITSKTFSSYKLLMHDLATAKTWQMAFGQDFGGMAQGYNKSGQQRTDACFLWRSMKSTTS